MRRIFSKLGIAALQIVLVAAIQRSESAVCIHMSPPSWICLPAPPHCTPPQPTLTPPSHHRAPSCAPFTIPQVPTICFIHDSARISTSVSQFIPFPPAVSKHLFFTFASLFLPYREVHLDHFSRFLIYALIQNICFSLSDLLHCV